jgi:hypothetical protein
MSHKGALLSIAGNIAVLCTVIAYAQQTLQLIGKLAVPVALLVIPIVCSALVIRFPLHAKTFSYVAMVYPLVLLLFVGLYITGSTFIQGINSIELHFFFIFVFALVAVGGNLVTIYH